MKWFPVKTTSVDDCRQQKNRPIYSVITQSIEPRLPVARTTGDHHGGGGGGGGRAVVMIQVVCG